MMLKTNEKETIDYGIQPVDYDDQQAFVWICGLLLLSMILLIVDRVFIINEKTMSILGLCLFLICLGVVLRSFIKKSQEFSLTRN